MKARVAFIQAVVMAALLSAIVAGLVAGSASAAGGEPGASGCAYGGIATASYGPGPQAGYLEISGQAATVTSGSVLVQFRGEPVGLLPVDATGAFTGSARIDDGIPNGDYTIDLAVTACSEPQTMLFIGDSITDGAFASSRDNHYPSLVMDELYNRYGAGAWTPWVYGVSSYGSLILDDSFNAGVNDGVYELDEPFFWPRQWWKDASPDLALIEVGVNNFSTGHDDGHDYSYRYDGTWRGYESDAEGLEWWKTDIINAVNYLTTQKGVPSNHILIMGHWPYGSDNPYGRGERYVGGAQEALWNQWNAEMRSQAEALGCVFIPMADVYGEGYLPDATKPGGDPDHYINHEHGDQSIHPNDKGFAMFASRVISYLPADLEVQRYRIPYKVSRVIKLSLGLNGSSWGSYEDYVNQVLTVRMSILNDGVDPAVYSEITDILTTNGAIVYSDLPMQLGGIAGGEGVNFDVRFLVPPGTMSFRVNVFAHANNEYGDGFDFPDRGGEAQQNH